MYESIPLSNMRVYPDHPPPYEDHVNGLRAGGSQVMTSSLNGEESIETIIANTESALRQSRMVFGAESHPGYHQLQELLRLLRDPVFTEIYRFNAQNKDIFSNCTDTSPLPEHFYRVTFPARPGRSWGFSIAVTEMNGDPSEVSLPEHEKLQKLVVRGVEPQENDPQEAHLRDMINPGDELIQINGNVIADSKEFKAERDRLSDRHQPTTFTFLQIKPNEMNNISMLRFQEQRLVIQLQAKDNSFGFAIVTNQNHRMTTIQKIVEEGAAHLDGRLRKGDILEYINNTSTAGLNAQDVVTLLRASVARVSLTVLRYEKLDYPIKFEKHLFQFYNVSLLKQEGSLGINIRSLPSSSDMSDQRLFIKDLVPGSVADACGLIQPMDQIIAVNGRCISHLQKDESLKMLKQEDQVHVTFLREIEPLPFSVNHTKLESSMTQPSREERVLFYRQRMPDKFAIYDGHILLHDLRTQMKQFRAKDGSISYIIENGTPARNLSTFSKSVSTCALEPGDEILEVDGIAARDNPGFSLEAIQGNQSRGYSYSNDTKFHIIFARPKRYSHQHTTSNPNIIHKREQSFGADEMIAHSNPQLSTFAASQHVYSMPQKHDRVLMSQDPARNDSDRSNDTVNYDSFGRHYRSTERLIKNNSNPNVALEPNRGMTAYDDLSPPSQEEASSPGHRMFVVSGLGEHSYQRINDTTLPMSPNKYKSRPSGPKHKGGSSVDSTPRNPKSAGNAEAEQYDYLRKSMMSEYQAPMSSSDEEEEPVNTNDTLSVCNETMWDSNVVYCTLKKEDGKSLGITICETTLDNSQPIVIIDQIVPGGVAEKSKVLSTRDRIVQVERYDTRKCTPEEFVKLISSIPSGKITLGIQKFNGVEPDDQQTIEEGPETETIERDDARPLLAQDDIYDVYQLENDDTENNENDAFTVMSLQRSKGAFDLHDRNLDDDSFIDRRADDTQSVSTASEAQAENYNRNQEGESEQNESVEKLYEWPQELQQIIRIERRHKEPMGMGLVSAEEITNQAPVKAGMYIRAITQEGLIGRDGRLKEGDFIIGINGRDLSGVPLTELASFMQTVASLESFKNFVELIFVSGETAQQFLNYPQLPSTQGSFKSHSNVESITESPTASARQNIREMQGAEAYMEEESGTDQSKANTLTFQGNTEAAYDSLNYQDPYSPVYSSMWEQATFGKKRLVEITRMEGEPLGLSIVDYPIGIVVQSVQEGSPADLDGPDHIQPLDRLTSINGIDLTNVTKDEAIQVIKNAKSPMRFVVEAVLFVENFEKPERLSKNLSDEEEEASEDEST